MKQVKITRGKEGHGFYGKISKIEFSNKSKMFISNKGWNIVLPKTKQGINLNGNKDKIEINLSFAEINIALEESIEQGYNNSQPSRNTEGKK